jgi:histidine ammonia-lyase
VGKEVVPGRQALKVADLDPFDLAPGEALACLSSNAYSVGVGALELARLDLLSNAADRVVALSLEAIAARGAGGNLSPFDEAVARATGRRGQADAAASVRANLAGNFTQDSRSVQDPLSFRTVPQLHGALRDQLVVAAAELETELNARSDNPLVDVDTNRIVSGGNFQVLALALQFDALRVTLAHVASASERRISALSELARPDRSAGTGLIPGLLWYSAAANLAEIRQLAAPASVAGAALSGVEDQATYAPLALQGLQRSRALTLEILAIEALHAAQLLDPAGWPTTALVPVLHALVTADLPAAALVDQAADLLAG